MPLSQVVKGSPVVVVGKIEAIDVAKASEERVYDIAHITVSKVLKNTLEGYPIKVGDKLPLSMPSVNNKVQISTDLHFKKGTEGVWILEIKDKTFWATYPKDYQAADREQKVQKVLDQQKQ